MNREKAVSKIQVDNDTVRVTRFLFQPGEETGMHKHTLDYVITPITNGELLIIDTKGNKSTSSLRSSESYFRKAGVEHNVINNGNSNLIFIETELKKLDKKD